MNADRLQEYWKNWVASGKDTHSDMWLDRYIKNDGKSYNTLDLGCGDGQETEYLLRCGHKVISADFEQSNLDKVDKISGSKTILFDMRKDWKTFDENQFDAVVASLSVQYFDTETTNRIFGEIKRILKPGGKLYARVNSTKDILHGAGDGELIEENFYIDRERGIPKRYFDEGAIKKFFTPFGQYSYYESIGKYDYKEKPVFEIVAVNEK